ncbi:unnamed protein product [Cunninghamella blakesleeana]
MTLSYTSAFLVIGDEILNGKIQDTNSHCLAKYLFELGIELKRIEVVGDNEYDIGEAVERLSKNHHFVFTSGGIGITHDDITYASIAKAFNLSLKLDDITWEKVLELRKKQLSHHSTSDVSSSLDGYKQMATFPSPSQHIREHPSIPIPIILVNNNVYILPGIPKLFKLLLYSLSNHFKQKISSSSSLDISDLSSSNNARPFYRRQIGTKKPEGIIANLLTDLQKSVERDNIKIGSYPTLNDNHLSVVISIVGKDTIKLDQITKIIVEKVDGWMIESNNHVDSKL